MMNHRDLHKDLTHNPAFPESIYEFENHPAVTLFTDTSTVGDPRKVLKLVDESMLVVQPSRNVPGFFSLRVVCKRSGARTIDPDVPGSKLKDVIESLCIDAQTIKKLSQK